MYWDSEREMLGRETLYVISGSADLVQEDSSLVDLEQISFGPLLLRRK